MELWGLHAGICGNALIVLDGANQHDFVDGQSNLLWL
jgi:hypothetical protein